LLRKTKHITPLADLTDQELIAKYIGADNKDLVGELFSRYTHLVLGICMEYMKNQDDAEDATMEIFEALFEKLKSHEIGNFKNWLYSVARNHCLMKLRRKKMILGKRGQIYKEYYAENMESAIPEHQMGDGDLKLKKKLELAFVSLKNEQQVCLNLMYIENLSYKEICEITGFSLKRVKSHIQNGKRKLKNLFETHGQ
jgi:RNA polymerase sigma factor (sigma-70 family)